MRRTMILFRLLGDLPYSRAHQIMGDAANLLSESTSQGSSVVRGEPRSSGHREPVFPSGKPVSAAGGVPSKTSCFIAINAVPRSTVDETRR
jgi:hypothetical protein